MQAFFLLFYHFSQFFLFPQIHTLSSQKKIEKHPIVFYNNVVHFFCRAAFLTAPYAERSLMRGKDYGRLFLLKILLLMWLRGRARPW
jgi:hypothetical protein